VKRCERALSGERRRFVKEFWNVHLEMLKKKKRGGVIVITEIEILDIKGPLLFFPLWHLLLCSCHACPSIPVPLLFSPARAHLSRGTTRAHARAWPSGLLPLGQALSPFSVRKVLHGVIRLLLLFFSILEGNLVGFTDAQWQLQRLIWALIATSFRKQLVGLSFSNYVLSSDWFFFIVKKLGSKFMWVRPCYL
jgi:hypothetical protein